MLDPLLLTDTLPASRDEAIEAAVNGMDLGTRDVVIVIARSFAGNCRYYGLARRFPNMLWFYQLKATQVPLKLESVDSKIWKAFHHHISGMILGRTASIPSTFKSYLIYAIPLALMGGWFLGWAQERVSPMFFSLLVLIGFFAAVVPVIKLSREDTQNASLRYRKVLTKWGPAFEKQGYWLVPVENNGWFYVQFTKMPAILLEQVSVKDEDLEAAYYDATDQPYNPDDWKRLEGIWNYTKSSEESQFSQTCFRPKLTSETHHFLGVQSEDTAKVIIKGTWRVCGCISGSFELLWESKGNTFQTTSQDLRLAIIPFRRNPKGAAVYYHFINPDCPKICKFEGSQMKMFEFPYLVCPSEDEIVNRLDANGVKMEDEWEHWDLYEKL